MYEKIETVNNNYMIYLFNIIFYSIFGFIFETSLKYIFDFDYNSGFLFGPYSLIYGLSITLMFYIFDKLKKHIKKNLIVQLIIYFILTFIIISILEFSAGFLIEKLFNKVYWNYSEYWGSIGKYINIGISSFWSIGIILIYYFLKPLTDKLYEKIDKKIITVMTIIILIDFIITLMLKLKF